MGFKQEDTHTHTHTVQAVCITKREESKRLRERRGGENWKAGRGKYREERGKVVERWWRRRRLKQRNGHLLGYVLKRGQFFFQHLKVKQFAQRKKTKKAKLAMHH